MAFNKQSRTYFMITILIFISILLPLIATINIDCKGKAFHCVNSTHFKICVDFGGISKTVDDFLIPCPESTVCTDSNYFECEYQTATTPVSVIGQSDVTNEQSNTTFASASDLNDVTTLLHNNVSKTELFENYYDNENTTPPDSNFVVTQATNSFSHETTNSEIGEQENLKPKNLKRVMINNLSDNNSFIEITTHSYLETGSKISHDLMEADVIKHLSNGLNGEQYDTTTSADFISTAIPFINNMWYGSTKNLEFQNKKQDIAIDREHNNEWSSDKSVDNYIITTNIVEQISPNKEQNSKQTVLQFPTTTAIASVNNTNFRSNMSENLNNRNNSFGKNVANISPLLRDEQHPNYAETTTESYKDLSLISPAKENKIQHSYKIDAVMTTTMPEELQNVLTVSDPLYDSKHFTKGDNIDLPTTTFESILILNTSKVISMPATKVSGFEDTTTQGYSQTEETTNGQSDFLLDWENHTTFPSPLVTTESSSTVQELTTDITAANLKEFKIIDDLYITNIENTTIHTVIITEPTSNNILTFTNVNDSLSDTVLGGENETYAMNIWESSMNIVEDKTINDIHMPSKNETTHLPEKLYLTTPVTATMNLFPTIMDILKNTYSELSISKSGQLHNNSYDTTTEQNDLFVDNVTEITPRTENTVKTDNYFPKKITTHLNDLSVTVSVHKKTLNDTITGKTQITQVTPNKSSSMSGITADDYLTTEKITTEMFTSSPVTAKTFLKGNGLMGNIEEVTSTTIVTEISNAAENKMKNYDRNRNVNLSTTTLHTNSYNENYNKIASINLTEPLDDNGSISSIPEQTPITILDVLSTPKILTQETSTNTALERTYEVHTFNNYTYNLTKTTFDMPAYLFHDKATDKFNEDNNQDLKVTMILDRNKSDSLSTNNNNFSDKEFKLTTTADLSTIQGNTRNEKSSITQVEYLITTNATYTTIFENVTVHTTTLKPNERLPKNNSEKFTMDSIYYKTNIHSSKNMQSNTIEEHIVTDRINDLGNYVPENPVTKSQDKLFGSLTTTYTSKLDESLYNIPNNNILLTTPVSVTEFLYAGTVNENTDNININFTKPDLNRDNEDIPTTTEIIKIVSTTRETLRNSTDFGYRNGSKKSNEFQNKALAVKLDDIINSYLNPDGISIQTNQLNKKDTLNNIKLSESINNSEKKNNGTTWVNNISDEKQKSLIPNFFDETRDTNRLTLNKVHDKINKSSQLVEIKDQLNKVESNKISRNIFNKTLPYRSPLANNSAVKSFIQPSRKTKGATGHLFSDTLDANSYTQNLTFNITQLIDKYTLNNDIVLDDRNKSYVKKANKAEITDMPNVESDNKLGIHKMYEGKQIKSHTLHSNFTMTLSDNHFPINQNLNTNEDKKDNNLLNDVQANTEERRTMKSNVTFISSLNSNKFIKSHVPLRDLVIKNYSVTTVSDESTKKPTNQTTQVLQKVGYYNPDKYNNDKFKIHNHFNCNDHRSGKYAERNNCSNFYICIGRNKPIIGICPNNTVFSEIKKQCTKNLSHCIRNKQFQCTSVGRYIDLFSDQFYYICVKKAERFIRLKLHCQKGYLLERAKLQCVSIFHNMSNEDSSNNTKDSSTFESTSKEDMKKSFECEKEGKFYYPGDCRKYYICTKNSKSEIRRRIKKCDSDEVFNKEKNKCVDDESYECTS